MTDSVKEAVDLTRGYLPAIGKIDICLYKAVETLITAAQETERLRGDIAQYKEITASLCSDKDYAINTIEQLRARIEALEKDRPEVDTEIEVTVCKSFDGRQCVYLNDHRVYGGKPLAQSNNIIGKSKCKLSDFIRIV